jgi:hypothetical protein
MAEGSDNWRALCKHDEANLAVRKMLWISSHNWMNQNKADILLASSEGFCSMASVSQLVSYM